MESVADLRKNLQQRGLDLIVRRGKPEDVVPSIAKAIGAHTVCLLIFQYYGIPLCFRSCYTLKV